ncbi:MAG: biotin synthase BioB [Anaerolineaceae bacterium]|nr:biotin synthase BioB [Anaerolineaceae bacterium]
MSSENVRRRIADLAAAPLDGWGVGRNEALEVLALARDYLWDVLSWANRIRRTHRGNKVHLCGIVAAKVGRCPEDCRWCSQSARHSANIHPHDLLSDRELLSSARRAGQSGAGCFGLVTSGAAPTADELDRLCGVIGKLRDDGQVSPCASLGMLDETGARKLAEAGCRRYNHNLETSRAYFPQVVTTHSWDQRLATARAVKAAGMELCCGGLFGIGESDRDRVDLAIAIGELDADSVPVNFLKPIAGTPLENAPPLSPEECLAILAMMRFVLPTKCIKAAGGREENLRGMQPWMFFAGADGILIGDYLTTGGRPATEDLEMIAALGMQPASPWQVTDTVS